MSESPGRHAGPDGVEITELERNAIEQLRERLHEDFPDVAPEAVDETVAEHYHALDESPIRDFVPVLVEHGAKSDLGQRQPAARPGPEPSPPE